MNQGPFLESQDPVIKVIHQQRLAALLKLKGLIGQSDEGSKVLHLGDEVGTFKIWLCEQRPLEES